jgi:hypothetical protein
LFRSSGKRRLAFRRENLFMVHLQWDFLFNYAGIQIQSSISSRGGPTRKGRRDLGVRDNVQEGSRWNLNRDCSISSSTIAMGGSSTILFWARRGAVSQKNCRDGPEKSAVVGKRGIAFIAWQQNCSKKALSWACLFPGA